MADHEISYPDHIESVHALEQACNSDEIDLRAKLVALRLKDSNGERLTVGIFEIEGDFNSGNLKLEQYASEIEKESLKAIHAAKGTAFRFKGEAYVQGLPVKVLAFGSHGSDEP